MRGEAIDTSSAWSGVLTDAASMNDAWGWYLYGVTRRRPGESETPGSLGMDDKPVVMFTRGDLVAIVSPVPSQEFTNESIQERLRDGAAAAGWIEEMVRGHERVVEAVHRERGVLPAKFGCVYASTADLVVALEHAQGALLARLRRVEGCDEWGIKLYADRAVVGQKASLENLTMHQLRQELSAASPGRAYFLRRKLADALADVADRAIGDLAQGGYERLAACARAGQINGRSDTPHSSPGESEILRAAFLVARDEVDRFVRELHRFTEGHEGLRCEYSGPWPPYSFVALEEAPK